MRLGLAPDQITIAVTVYNRRQYLRQAIRSALSQSVPVRVLVVEDCGPDPMLQSYVTAEFGSRVAYVPATWRPIMFVLRSLPGWLFQRLDI